MLTAASSLVQHLLARGIFFTGTGIFFTGAASSSPARAHGSFYTGTIELSLLPLGVCLPSSSLFSLSAFACRHGVAPDQVRPHRICCSAKAHQDSRPIGLPPIWSCFPLAKGEGEGELKLGAPLFFGHMHIKMPPTTVQKL
uniref:Uncharacterized protein n=1 Tax=Fagus sylvatica TaxID=28930 RepID=A0A2N9GX82_FAGSY